MRKIGQCLFAVFLLELMLTNAYAAGGGNGENSQEDDDPVNLLSSDHSRDNADDNSKKVSLEGNQLYSSGPARIGEARTIEEKFDVYVQGLSLPNTSPISNSTPASEPSQADEPDGGFSSLKEGSGANRVNSASIEGSSQDNSHILSLPSERTDLLSALLTLSSDLSATESPDEVGETEQTIADRGLSPDNPVNNNIEIYYYQPRRPSPLIDSDINSGGLLSISNSHNIRATITVTPVIDSVTGSPQFATSRTDMLLYQFYILGVTIGRMAVFQETETNGNRLTYFFTFFYNPSSLPATHPATHPETIDIRNQLARNTLEESWVSSFLDILRLTRDIRRDLQFSAILFLDSYNQIDRRVDIALADPFSSRHRYQLPDNALRVTTNLLPPILSASHVGFNLAGLAFDYMQKSQVHNNQNLTHPAVGAPQNYFQDSDRIFPPVETTGPTLDQHIFSVRYIGCDPQLSYTYDDQSGAIILVEIPNTDPEALHPLFRMEAVSPDCLRHSQL